MKLGIKCWKKEIRLIVFEIYESLFVMTLFWRHSYFFFFFFLLQRGRILCKRKYLLQREIIMLIILFKQTMALLLQSSSILVYIFLIQKFWAIVDRPLSGQRFGCIRLWFSISACLFYLFGLYLCTCGMDFEKA